MLWFITFVITLVLAWMHFRAGLGILGNLFHALGTIACQLPIWAFMFMMQFDASGQEVPTGSMYTISFVLLAISAVVLYFRRKSAARKYMDHLNARAAEEAYIQDRAESYRRGH